MKNAEADEESHFSNSPAKNGGNMHHFEIEEETDSLIYETSGNGLDAAATTKSGLAFRKTARKGVATAVNGHITTASFYQKGSELIGLVRSRIGNSATVRNFVVLAILSICIMIWVHLDWLMLQMSPQKVTPRPHASSFGGDRNPGHYITDFNDDFDLDLLYDDTNFGYTDDLEADLAFSSSKNAHLPKSNVGREVISRTRNNDINLNGNFQHDPFLSPYASALYADFNATERMEMQRLFDEQRQTIIKKFGKWELPQYNKKTLTSPDFRMYPNKDMPVSRFPSDAWQKDVNYTVQFLEQAKDLVRRVQNAIILEYGKDPENDDDLKDFRVIFETDPKFATLNGVAVDRTTQEPLRGVAFLNGIAWEGLVRKLLHAMMTKDDFYVVAVGGGAYTYLANNFGRTQVMRFNEIMEPVFDKLGVKLISRNMGMDASSTVSALGGADIYGEADIFWYISDRRASAKEESDGQMDLLQRQAILSGQRMPIILTPNPVGLAKEARGKAWVGNIQNTVSICDVTVDKEHLPNIKACEYVNCGSVAVQQHVCDVYNSVCWVNRVGWNPSIERGDTEQNNDAGHIGEGYPNFRQHQWEGRKLSLLVLQALQEAIQRWTSEATANRLPLNESMWHVDTEYEALRQSIRTLERTAGESALAPSCETMLSRVDPMICHMSMHVITEWTPRVNPGIRLMKFIESSVFDNSVLLKSLYGSVDLLPIDWRLEVGEVDVHMVAISTNETFGTGVRIPIENATQSFYDDDVLWPQQLDDIPLYDDVLRGRMMSSHESKRLLKLNKSGRLLKGAMNMADTATALSPPQHQRRLVQKIAPDKWTLYERQLGFCDGSAQSACNRRVGNTCLLANQNHYKAGLVGHGSSEWLYMSLPITEGIVLLRFEWNLDLETGEKLLDSESLLSNLPNDFMFEVNTDGKQVKYSLPGFIDLGIKIVDDLIVYPVYLNKEMSQKEGEHEQLKLGIRFSAESGAEFRVLLTHVYYT